MGTTDDAEYSSEQTSLQSFCVVPRVLASALGIQNAIIVRVLGVCEELNLRDLQQKWHMARMLDKKYKNDEALWQKDADADIAKNKWRFIAKTASQWGSYLGCVRQTASLLMDKATYTCIEEVSRKADGRRTFALRLDLVEECVETALGASCSIVRRYIDSNGKIGEWEIIVGSETEHLCSTFHPLLAVHFGINEAFVINHVVFRSKTGWLSKPYSEWKREIPWCCMKTVMKVLRGLISDGILVMKPTRALNNGQTANKYRLDLPRLESLLSERAKQGYLLKLNGNKLMIYHKSMKESEDRQRALDEAANDSNEAVNTNKYLRRRR